ncbi:uncharacterized protein LOC131269063 isoform X2 [Anopheles coustani]|uniref:uncharacterized protein LOC131269063 isoform X2 n=1 Tax=Anopheles coustani TaxID=139045 RepID=UPI00265879D7|nr:uncharacterized protein LOC131269063 isoform X2 [Anopheles coustani]
MARLERYVVVVGLIVLLVIVGSLSAFPQTYKPLIRSRTEQREDEVNSGYDLDRDQKLPEVLSALEETTQGLPLGPRIDEGDKSSKNNYNIPGVYRDENASTVNETKTDVRDMIGDHFAIDSYPEDYPFETIRHILAAKPDVYGEFFEKEPHTEELVTRIDSPADPYLCSSTQKPEYPVYDPTTQAYIVNVKEYYQSVTYEKCDNPKAACSNVNAAKGGKLYCEQVYGEYEVFTVPKDGPKRFVKTKLKFPSCCKCRHEVAEAASPFQHLP